VSQSTANLPSSLLRLGVDPQRFQALAAAFAMVGDPWPLEHLPALLDEAPDPLLASATLERLLVLADPSPMFARSSSREKAWQALFVLCGGSVALGNTLAACGGKWPEQFLQALESGGKDAAAHFTALEDESSGGELDFGGRLRRYRHREYLRIGLADLLVPDAVERTWLEISELADGCVAATYRWARASLARELGEVGPPDRPPLQFVVLAMGKLGGKELNFSSDIDLVYLYESDWGDSAKGEKGSSARAFFTTLSERITRTLQEVTADGFAFRVDLRLRPDGINGPITNSVPNALLYYESYGQTWERTALLKARPCGGDVTLGEAFLRELRPFVYRRFLDYSTVADMQRMKAQIEASLRAKSAERDVKLGRGGIREIEFFVQVLQLIHGGRDERVRSRSTVQALERLAECRYIPPEEGQGLIEAYRFLRNVEHKIQIVAQRQTHSVPSEEREQETLARRLGWRGERARQAFWETWERHRARVRAAFEKLLYEAQSERRARVSGEVEQLVAHLDDREKAEELLRAFGFSDPAASYEDLRLLRDGPPSSPSTPRRRQVLYELAPLLLSVLRESPAPDLALHNFANFIAAVGARTSFLVLLQENPATLRMLANLFATSQYLANQFIRHPEMLDSLVRADLVRMRRSKRELVAELESLLAVAEDYEQSLDALRRFRNEEFLRIGIAAVQGALDTEEVAAELTLLAEACLEGACRVAKQQALVRFELAELPGELAIVGLGKFGAGELNFNSDLDLIFVYEEKPAPALRLSAHEVFTWLAQRLLTTLQVPTKEGIVYRIDTRLRPSGHSGPLVSSLESFQRYHAESAQVWERQALIKARVVYGPPPLAACIERVVEGFVYRSPLRPEEAREIRRLRGRMERELARESAGHVNIKTGRGGLVDIEFLVQMLQLSYGPCLPAVRCRATRAALDALYEQQVIPEEVWHILSDGYRFLRRLEQTLRLIHDRAVEDLERADMDVVVVGRRLGLSGEPQAVAEQLWAAYTARREAIRRQYETWFERAEGNELPRVAGCP